MFRVFVLFSDFEEHKNLMLRLGALGGDPEQKQFKKQLEYEANPLNSESEVFTLVHIWMELCFKAVGMFLLRL